MGRLVRVVTTQKCILNANDHIELESVGRDDQKLTVVEELNAFSFGDYSKVGFNFNISLICQIAVEMDVTFVVKFNVFVLRNVYSSKMEWPSIVQFWIALVSKR